MLLSATSSSIIPKVYPIPYVLPFQPATFDTVFLVALLEHTRRPDLILAEAARVLRPGGQLMTVIPNDFWMTAGRMLLGQRPFRVPDHVTRLSPTSVRRLGGPWFQETVAFCLPFRRLGFALNTYGVAFFQRRTCLPPESRDAGGVPASN